MDQDEVVLIDLFDVLGNETSIFVKHLPTGDDLSLYSGAFGVFLLYFRKILIREDLVVEGDGVLIGAIAIDDVGQLVAIGGVYCVFLVVGFLLLHVLLKLFDEEVTFLLEFVLLFRHVLLLDLLKVQQVDLGSPF